MGIQALTGVPWKTSFHWSAVWPLWPIVQFWNDAGEGAHTSRVTQMSRSALAMTGVTDVIVIQLSYTSDCSFHSQSPSSFTYSYLAAEEKCSHWEILSVSAVNVTPLCYYFRVTRFEMLKWNWHRCLQEYLILHLPRAPDVFLLLTLSSETSKRAGKRQSL